MKSIFFTFFTYIIGIFASDYILIPKDTQSYSIYQTLAEKYNLNLFASINGIHFYKTSSNNLFNNKQVLSDFYDIEEDGIVSLDNSDFIIMRPQIQQNVPWHLARIVSRKGSTNNGFQCLSEPLSFPYSESGSCHRNNQTVINSYVVDTGIDINHPEFEGRAVWSANFADETDTDCNNHGTHVAGLIGSKNYGVCVDANLFAVKVLDCQGSGSFSGVIGGIEWVYKTHKKQTEAMKEKGDTRVLKSIINMSLGGGYSRAINKAIEACVDDEQNFYVVVAAGNENSDACKTSPASVKNIITVMASAVDDSRAWFSNWGPCANIYAPGVDIVSTIPDNSFATYSGTSMASPVMAGVLNHYLDMHVKQNMSTIAKTVYLSATKNVIDGEKKNTVNLLVYLHR